MASYAALTGAQSRAERARAQWRRQLRGLRRTLERVAPRLVLLAAAALLVVSKADLRFARWASALVADVAVPVVAVLREPFTFATGVGERLGELLAVQSENERLRAENQLLRRWRAEAVRLGVENRALREMLAMPPAPATARQTVARVVADSGGPFLQARLIDAGADRGVLAGMAVVDEHGLVGRVIASGRRSARILLLTDFNSRIPVVIAPSGDHAILEGDNTGRPRLRFLPLDPTVDPGDRVLTSGRDGLLPPGLPVGEIERVDDTGVAVRPYADWERLDYVAVLQYTRLLPPEGAAEGPAAPSAMPDDAR